jgi:hypothetical protein
MPDTSPTNRFTDRVESYVRARPGYLTAVIDTLRNAAGMSAGWKVADVGAGTGISAKLVLDAGWEVMARGATTFIELRAQFEVANMRANARRMTASL